MARSAFAGTGIDAAGLQACFRAREPSAASIASSRGSAAAAQVQQQLGKLLASVTELAKLPATPASCARSCLQMLEHACCLAVLVHLGPDSIAMSQAKLQASLAVTDEEEDAFGGEEPGGVDIEPETTFDGFLKQCLDITKQAQAIGNRNMAERGPDDQGTDGMIAIAVAPPDIAKPIKQTDMHRLCMLDGLRVLGYLTMISATEAYPDVSDLPPAGPSQVNPICDAMLLLAYRVPRPPSDDSIDDHTTDTEADSGTIDPSDGLAADGRAHATATTGSSAMKVQ